MGDNLTLIIFGCVLIISILLVIFSSRRIKRKNYDGAIRVNTSDPERDTYTLELNISFGELETRDQVIFEIIHE